MSESQDSDTAESVSNEGEDKEDDNNKNEENPAAQESTSETEATESKRTPLEAFFAEVVACCDPLRRFYGVMGLTLKTDEFAQYDAVFQVAKGCYPKLKRSIAESRKWRKNFRTSETLREEGNEWVSFLASFCP